MFHSKKLVLIAILGIVVAGSSNSVLIPQVWSQRRAPPTDQKDIVLLECPRIIEGHNSAKVIDAEAAAEFRLQKRISTGGKTNLKDILMYHAGARLSDDANTVLVDSGAILQMWDVTTGKLKQFSESGSTGGMMAFVPDSSLVYYANGGLQFWDSATGTKQGKVIPHADGPAEAWKEHYRPAVDPVGKLIATRTAESKLRLWQVNSQQPASEEFVHEDSITQLSFSSDGRWLFSKCRDEWTARSIADPKSAVGPLPDNVSRSAVYSAKSQRLATFKNSGSDDTSKCEITVHNLGATDPVEVRRVKVDAHIGRHCTWVDGNHLLVCGESRGRPTPSTLFLISMQVEKPIIRKETLFRDGRVTGVAVAADHRHYLVSTYRSTTCWKLGQEEHVWQVGTSEAGRRHHLHIGTGDWVLLHEKGQTTGARPAIVRSLKNGNELWRKESVISADANGEAFCIVDAKGIEVWTANDANTQEPRRLRSSPDG